MERDKVGAAHPLDRREVPFGFPGVGMIGAVDQPGNGIHRAHRRIVVVLPQGGDRLRARLLDLALRKRGTTGDVQQNGKDGGEILGKTGAGDAQPMTRGRDAQRDAAFVELLRNHVRRSPHGPAIEDAADHLTDARKVGRIEQAARGEGAVDRDCWRHRRRLHQQDTAVCQRGLGGGQAALQSDGHDVSPEAGTSRPCASSGRDAVARRRSPDRPSHHRCPPGDGPGTRGRRPYRSSRADGQCS